ncbi:MAG TPA: hypothetical protein PKE03_04185 [Bacteroidales bacterium]|mgnify:CR=1 FL=1|nr:hypothetical protein [Bacteroidales bacterium]
MEKSSDEIGRIRQILFGHNMSDLEKRIEGLDAQMQSSLEAIDIRIGKLFESIESAQRQLEELRSGLADSLHQLSQQEKALLLRISSVSDSLYEETDKLKLLLSDTAGILRTEQSRIAESQTAALTQLRDQINSKISLMQSSKVDRTALALLLNELALQLGTSESQAPDETISGNE